MSRECMAGVVIRLERDAASTIAVKEREAHGHSLTGLAGPLLLLGPHGATD